MQDQDAGPPAPQICLLSQAHISLYLSGHQLPKETKTKKIEPDTLKTSSSLEMLDFMIETTFRNPQSFEKYEYLKGLRSAKI